MATIPFHLAKHSQDMARDKEKPHLDVLLNNPYLVLKGTGPDVESTLLSGQVALVLTEATSIKELTLQFRGKAKIPLQASDSIVNSAYSTHVICNHDWSFLEGDKKHSHTLKAGRHVFPFQLEIGGSLPSSITTLFGGASVAYKLRAVATRPGFSYNLQAVAPVYILRSITREALEYQQTLDIENTWPEKLMYAITLPHKAWAAGDTLTAIVKLSPLTKGIYVQGIISSITETTKIFSKSGNHEHTRVVASVRHEIIDRKAVEVELHSHNSSAAAGSSNALGTPVSHSPPISRPSSPPGASSSHHHHHHPHHHHHHPPHQQEQEEEDLEFESTDIVTSLNLSIPLSSAYPHLFSASILASAYAQYAMSSSQPLTSPDTLLSSTNASHNVTLPTTTPPLSASPAHQHVPLPPSTNSASSHPTSSSFCSYLNITPSHSLDPIQVSHRIKWHIFIHNKDGHVSELRCSLPINILDGALLEESRLFTMRSRRLLLRASGLGSALGRGGEEDGEDEDEAAEEEERMEADRELPSYPAHVRDRVANMYLSEAATIRVSNPWVGGAPAGVADGNAGNILNSPELLGQGGLDIINPLHSSAPHSQPHSRGSHSGRSTPVIPSLQHVMSHLPHAPEASEIAPLDWVNSELLLRLNVDEEPRWAENLPPSLGGQQQQQQQQQHQSHSNLQQSRTITWGNQTGSRAGSRAASPERSPLPSTANNDNSGSNSISEGTTSGDTPGMHAPGHSSGSGFATPLHNLFKATMKPFSALTGHHGHGHRPTKPHSRSTPLLMGSHSTAGSDLSPPPSSTGPTSSSSPSSPASHNGIHALNPLSRSSSSSQSLATFGITPTSPSSSSPLSDLTLESASTSPFPTAPTSDSASPFPHVHQPESQDPSSRFYRAFTTVPDYSIASMGFIGGVPPLSSMRGLPSYEEAEAQRREAQALKDRETHTPLSIPNQAMERGSMSESDLASRFGHAVRFESGTQIETTTEAGTHSLHRDNGGGVGIIQRLEDGDEDGDDDDDDADATAAIQIRTKKARP